MGEAYILSQPKMVQSDAFISDVTDVGKKTPKNLADMLTFTRNDLKLFYNFTTGCYGKKYYV